MKYLKMLGLAAIAAMALMAFAGAGSASADELCTENVTPCPAAKVVTSIEASLVGSAKLEAGGVTLDTCTAGTVAGTVSSQGAGKAITGPINTISWGTGSTPCTSTTTTIKTGTLEANWSKETNGTVVSAGGEVTVNNSSVGDCTYGTGSGTDLGEIKGGTEAHLTIVATVKKTAGGILCPGTAVWNATYRITNHTAVYVHNN